MIRRLVAAFAFVLMFAAPALAVGPVVGTNCIDSWTAPATDTTGAPLTGPVTYNIWQVQGVQTAPGVPPKLTGVTTTTISPGCPVAGQFTNFFSAVANGLESAPSPGFPYVVVIPNAPASFTVSAGGSASWSAVTTYTDSTTIAGSVSYEIWVMPSTALAPSGPPTMTVTGTTATLTTVAGAGKAFIRTLTTPTPGGSTSESAALASPFAVAVPNPPSNATVK